MSQSPDSLLLTLQPPQTAVCNQSDTFYFNERFSASSEETNEKGGHQYVSMRPLNKFRILTARFGLLAIIAAINVGLMLVLLFVAPGILSLAIICCFKARDVLCVVWQSLHYTFQLMKTLFKKKASLVEGAPPSPCALVSIVPVYREEPSDVAATVDSIIENGVNSGSNNLVCLICDGFAFDHSLVLDEVVDATDISYYRDYKDNDNGIHVTFGLRKGQSVIIMKKARNAGKKDSLILAFDIFNRSSAASISHLSILRARFDMHAFLSLQGLPTFFDFILTTDADTIITKGSIQSMLDQLQCEGERALATCGIVDVAPAKDWRGRLSFWDHFQMYQYLFGQWVRRRAESTWGRVTCLPGALTLIRTGKPAASAIAEYRKPVLSASMVTRQVQHLGTDRRLTWCLLVQGAHYRVLLSTSASCITRPPQSLRHFLSQRRRWGSNAFFNALVTLGAPEQHVVTRLWMLAQVSRDALIFFRLFNFAHFLFGLATSFHFAKIAPLLAVTLLPQLWFMAAVVIPQQKYRHRLFGLLYGEILNRTVGLFISPLVFINVLLSFGSHEWGRTHAARDKDSEQATD